MQTKHQVTLGQQVFMLTAAGDIVRTMVGRIQIGDTFNNFEPRHTLLNGESGQHWFTYQEALTASQDRAEQQIKALKKRLAELRLKSKRLRTEG